MSVLGVDACRGGWVGIRLDPADAPRAFYGPTITDLAASAGPVDVIAIDIPMGLKASSFRDADALARKVLGPRASSVFTTPPRPALEAPTYVEANRTCVELTGKGLSKQAYAIAPKVLEVDRWVTGVGVQVVEVHPEVSFATLAGGVLNEPKATWAGFQLRRSLLAAAGIFLDHHLGLAGVKAAPDDVLDAAVAAWSAERVQRGAHLCLPDPPEVLGDGRRAAIWA